MTSTNSSRNLRWSTMSQRQLSTQPTHPHPALLLTDTLLEIFSHVSTPQDLLQYRGVCQKWNDVIGLTLNTKWKNCFPLRLRYDPRSLRRYKYNKAPRAGDTREILAHPPLITFTDTDGTTTSLSFDTIVVYHDFNLAAVNPEWQHFLQIYGTSIRHLKFNIQSFKLTDRNFNHVNFVELVSRENLQAAFSAMPNLESLDFSICFTQYCSTRYREMNIPRLMFPETRQITPLPQLEKLTKITIHEPHGISYSLGFLTEILGMAPNLTTLNIKWLQYLSIYANILRSLPHLDNSLKTLGISMTDRSIRFPESLIHDSGFSRFRLTKLELNCITGTGVHLEAFLQSQSSTLTTLILGDRVTPNPDPSSYHGPASFHRDAGVTIVIPLVRRNHMCRPLYRNPLRFPSIMDSLKTLEVNLPKFTLAPITSYLDRFPALEELTLSNCEETGCVWTYQRIQHMFPGVIGQSHTLKKFTLLGPIGDADRDIIISAVSSTFPFAEQYFGL